MNLFNRAIKNSRRRRKSGGKAKPRSGRPAKNTKSRKSAKTGSGRATSWLLGAALVVVVAGVGLLKWARTGTGQATLLSLGSDKMYSEVQSTVEGALAEVLPGLVPGPAEATAVSDAGHQVDSDWPAPQFGPNAAVRCRTVPVGADLAWWDLQSRVAAAAEKRGAQVLWAERVFPGRRLPEDQTLPNEEKDMLRMDVGVKGRPTHTLVLYRAGRRPDVHWGSGPGSSAWSRLAADDGPVVALVVDDWGYSKSEAARTILSLPAPITMAVLPGLPYSRHFALKSTELVLPADIGGDREPAAGKMDSGRRLRLSLGCFVEVGTGPTEQAHLTQRREILLHLPMEPQGYPEPDPGAKAIMVGMGQEAIGLRIDEARTALPMITGVNNHMGSAATGDRPTMVGLMQALRSRDLLFIDSLTSSKSVAYAEAQKAGLPSAKNRIFLDYDNKNHTTIKANLEVLVRSARSSGFALGICHPHRATAEVLAREVPRLIKQGVRFVTVSEMLALKDLALTATAGG